MTNLAVSQSICAYGTNDLSLDSTLLPETTVQIILSTFLKKNAHMLCKLQVILTTTKGLFLIMLKILEQVNGTS